MSLKKSESFNNLLDFVLHMDEDTTIAGKGKELFQHVMCELFFKHEVDEKAVLSLFKNMKTPVQFKEVKSLLDMTMEHVREFVEAETINDTFAGQVLLSAKYLKSMYPQYSPEFTKFPSEIQQQLIDKIKAKNSNIIKAFEKMHEDIDADKRRSVLHLIAMVIKNVHLKTGFPLKESKYTVVEIVKKQFNNADQTFNGDPTVVAELNDDKRIRYLVKEFFLIKQHSDIVEIANLVKVELARFEWRLAKIIENGN